MSQTEEAANSPFPYEMFTNYYADKQRSACTLFKI